MPLRRVGVLSGNNPDAPSEFHAAAAALGQVLAQLSLVLLYDGDVRGPLADLLEAFKDRGQAEQSSAEELVQRCDAAVALPGGPLSLEQLLELGLRPGAAEKPFGLLNSSDYFTQLLTRGADEAVDRFVRETQRGRLIVNRDAAELLRALEEFRPPETRRRTL